MIRESEWQLWWEPLGESGRLLLDFGDLLDGDIVLPRDASDSIGRPDFAASAIPSNRGNVRRRIEYAHREEHETIAASWEACYRELAALPWGAKGILSLRYRGGLDRYYTAAIGNSSHSPQSDGPFPVCLHELSFRVAPLSAIILPDGLIVTGGYWAPGGNYHVPQLPPGTGIPAGTGVIITGTPGVRPGRYVTGGSGVPAGGGADVPMTPDEDPAVLPVSTAAPSIGGDTYPGGVLNAAAGTWLNADSVTRRWYLNGAALPATGTSFTIPDSAAEGDTIHLQETAINGSLTAAANSNTVIVTDPPPVNVLAPVIAGTPEPGETLTATPGTWDHADSIAGEWWLAGAATGITTTLYEIPLTANPGDAIFYRESAANAVATVSEDSNALVVGAAFDDSALVLAAADLWVALSGGTWSGTRSFDLTLEWIGLPAGTTVEIWSEGPVPAAGSGSLPTGSSFSFQVNVDPVGSPQEDDIDIFSADLDGKDYYADAQTTHADYPDLNGRAVQYVRNGCNSILIRVRDAGNNLLAQFFITPFAQTTCRMRSTAPALVDQDPGRAMRIVMGEGGPELLVPNNFLVT